MTDPETGPTAAQPPTVRLGKWVERALFFVSGIASFFACDRLARLLPGPTGIVEIWLTIAVGLGILSMRILRGPQWRWLSYFAGVAFTWCAFLAFLLGPSTIASYLKTRDFDAEAWRNAVPGESEVRVWMVDDLLANHSPVGRPASEIDALLGPDDRASGSGFGAGYFERDWDRVWWLGPERGFMSIDSEWLVLRVGKDGTVTEAKDVHD